MVQQRKTLQGKNICMKIFNPNLLFGGSQQNVKIVSFLCSCERLTKDALFYSLFIRYMGEFENIPAYVVA